MQILIVNALSKGHIRGYRTPVDQTPLTPELREVIIGVLLGDCHAQKRCPNSNVSLLFSQAGNNIEYGHHLYTLFKTYCLSAPKVSLQSNKQSGKIFDRLRFATRTKPEFNEYHSLFYREGRKIVPSNIYHGTTYSSWACLPSWLWTMG